MLEKFIKISINPIWARALTRWKGHKSFENIILINTPSEGVTVCGGNGQKILEEVLGQVQKKEN